MSFLIYLGSIYSLNILILMVWLSLYIDIMHSDQENLSSSILTFIIIGLFIDALSAICLDSLLGLGLSYCMGNVIVSLMISGVFELWHLMLLPFDIDTTRCHNWRVLPKKD